MVKHHLWRPKYKHVIKASGRVEPFIPHKLEASLEGSKVDPWLADKLYEYLEQKQDDKDQITTADLRNQIHTFLKRNHTGAAAHYKLREAVMQLGPDGFAFEKYFAHILHDLDYAVHVGQMVQGSCVQHEVDVVAIKDDLVEMVECKFHNRFGVKSDVKVAMYVWARFVDIKDAYDSKLENSRKFNDGWLVTNTKLTDDARKFATCRGLKIVSWNHPHGSSLKDMIEKRGHFPVTVLTDLRSHTVQLLLDRGIVSCGQLLAADDRMLADLAQNQIRKARVEAQTICEYR